MRQRGLRRVGLIVAVAAVALATTSCFPVLHPTFRVVSAPGSSVDFQLLSRDGNFAVVRSASGESRIDRRDQSVVALPNLVPSAISRDGSRVFFGSVLWVHGVTLTPPSGIQMSRDLTYGVFVDTDGFVKRWRTATQTVSDVETGFPRPSPVYEVHPLDISDDGHMVEYAFTQHIAYFVRFADLSTHQAYDDASVNNLASVPMASSGTAFLDATRLSEASVISLPSGTVHTYSLGLTSLPIEGGWISDSGAVAWLYLAGHAFQCPVAPRQCTVESAMVALLPNGARRSLDSGPGELTAGSVRISRSGRFLLFTKDTVVSVSGPLQPGPVQVVDWLNGVETLTASDGSHPSRSGYISDDGTILATTSTGGGWYEYTPA